MRAIERASIYLEENMKMRISLCGLVCPSAQLVALQPTCAVSAHAFWHIHMHRGGYGLEVDMGQNWKWPALLARMI